jgi:predicted thioesterase
MSDALIPGVSHEIEVKTGPEHTARYFYENLPGVFATPFLAGFMERTSAELINQHLESGQQSVGISMNLQHSAATPLGKSVRVRAELTARDGKKLTFKVEAWDPVEKIGEAVHDRFIIKAEKFNARVAQKGA